jgi:hypothetical protein
MTKETYTITMSRTYCTTFEIEASNEEEALALFKAMPIEDKCIEELEQCNITETYIEL